MFMVLTNKRSLYNIITSTNLPKAKNIESKKKKKKKTLDLKVLITLLFIKEIIKNNLFSVFL